MGTSTRPRATPDRFASPNGTPAAATGTGSGRSAAPPASSRRPGRGPRGRAGRPDRAPPVPRGPRAPLGHLRHRRVQARAVSFIVTVPGQPGGGQPAGEAAEPAGGDDVGRGVDGHVVGDPAADALRDRLAELERRVGLRATRRGW